MEFNHKTNGSLKPKNIILNDILNALGPPSTESTFDNDVWIYIERKESKTSIATLGRRKLTVNNVFKLVSTKLNLKKKKKVNEWQNLGVRRIDGTDLPKKNIYAYLIMIKDNDKKRYFLVYKNFKIILRWNTSNYFAIAVGKLSDSISIK